MARSTVLRVGFLGLGLSAWLLGGLPLPAWASDAADRPPTPPGCGERAPETAASLRKLVRVLEDSNDPGQMAVGDRLKCAVHLYPELALRLLLPLVGGDDRIASLMAAKSIADLGPGAHAAVPQLVAMLRSEDETTRVIAAQTLAKFGPASEPAVDALIALLDDESALTRRAAARTLAFIGPGAARAAVPIANQLPDSHPQVRGTASYALQELAHHGCDAVPVLIGLLQHQDPDVRRRAAGALGNIGPLARDAQPALAAVRDDPDEDEKVRRAARGALGKLDLQGALMIGQEGAGHLLPMILERLKDDDPALRREAAGLLGYLGPSALPATNDLLMRVEDDDAAVRVMAVHTLGVIGASEEPVVRAIAKHLADEDLAMRRAASRALAGFGAAAAPATDALVLRLADYDAGVRESSTDALLAIDPSGGLALSELLVLLGDENAIVHFGAAYELSRRSARFPHLVHELTARLRHDDENVSVAAARALSQMGPAAEPALPVLRELIDGPDPRMRGVATDLLGKLGGQLPGTAGGDEALEILAARIDDPDLMTRLQALHSLRQFGPAARGQVPKLLALLRHPEIQTRQSAADVLAAVLEGDPSPVLGDLLALLEDPEPLVRANGAYALSRHGSAAALALEPLVGMLDDPHPLPRGYAAVALGEIGPPAAEALPRLKELQRDPDYRVNTWARKAVGQIRSGGARSGMVDR